MPKKVTIWKGDKKEYQVFQAAVQKVTRTLNNKQLAALVKCFLNIDTGEGSKAPNPVGRAKQLVYVRQCYYALWRTAHALGDNVNGETDPATMLENAEDILSRHKTRVGTLREVSLSSGNADS